MHLLTNDRMKWGQWALVLGAIAGVRTGLTHRPAGQPVRTKSDAIRIAQTAFHQEICAAHCWNGAIEGVCLIPLLARDHGGRPVRHRWVYVNSETKRTGTGVCVYETGRPAGCPSASAATITDLGREYSTSD